MKLPILLFVISSILASVCGYPNDVNGPDTSQARSHTDASKIKFKLFTKRFSMEGKIISANEPSLLTLAGFDPSLKTIMLIHGWLSNSLPTLSGFRLKNELPKVAEKRELTRSNNANWHQMHTLAVPGGAFVRQIVIFNQSERNGVYFNVILVDWSDIDTILYWVAASKVPVIGNQTAQVMRLITDTFKYDPSNFHIIGHSLGAHIAGTTVRLLENTAPLITGLDPAGPLFLADNPLRLNSMASRNVLIIYSCGNYLSIPDGVGHTNIYPSGGTWPQPGCSWDIRGVCSHCRSYIILVEMILNSGIKLAKCENFEAFKKGNCNNEQTENIDFLFPVDSPRGNFYFISNNSPPYCPSARVSVDKTWDKTVAGVGC